MLRYISPTSVPTSVPTLSPTEVLSTSKYQRPLSTSVSSVQQRIHRSQCLLLHDASLYDFHRQRRGRLDTRSPGQGVSRRLRQRWQPTAPRHRRHRGRVGLRPDRPAHAGLHQPRPRARSAAGAGALPAGAAGSAVAARVAPEAASRVGRRQRQGRVAHADARRHRQERERPLRLGRTVLPPERPGQAGGHRIRARSYHASNLSQIRLRLRLWLFRRGRANRRQQRPAVLRRPTPQRAENVEGADPEVLASEKAVPKKQGPTAPGCREPRRRHMTA